MRKIVILLLFFYSSLIFADSAKIQDTCHPKADFQLPQYIVGYGSLMESKSKNKTYDQTGENLPVSVQGFKRGWLTHGMTLHFSATFLGVIRDPNAKFNGVIFQLHHPHSLYKYDDREKAYCRVAIPAKNIKMLSQHFLPSAQYWIYVQLPRYQEGVNNQYPIVQSYVDTFLSGCLEMQNKYHLQNFAKDCILSTSGWSEYWLNDRIFPRRPSIHQPNALIIDKMLQSAVPQHFSKVKLEGGS